MAKNYKVNSPKVRVKSHYRMRGMGSLLTMFGGAAEEIESAYDIKRTAFLNAKKEYEQEKDKSNRDKLRKIMESAKSTMEEAKDKMNALLKGVKEAASKVGSHLSDSAKMLGSKLSSGMKSFGSKLSSGMKSFGSKLSSGAKSASDSVTSDLSSISSQIKGKYNQYKKNKDMKNLQRLNEKYYPESSNLSSQSSSETLTSE